mgnify:CR=1 FL=1
MLQMIKLSIPVESGNLAARSGRIEKAKDSFVKATNAEAA